MEHAADIIIKNKVVRFSAGGTISNMELLFSEHVKTTRLCEKGVIMI
jgi:hypothetical protein